MTAQDVLVTLAAALAFGWLFLRWWRSRRRADAACANCPSASPVPGVRPAPQPEMLLAIGEPSPAPPVASGSGHDRAGHAAR